MIRKQRKNLNVHVIGIQRQAYLNLKDGMYQLMYNYLGQNGIVKMKTGYLTLKKNKEM